MIASCSSPKPSHDFSPGSQYQLDFTPVCSTAPCLETGQFRVGPNCVRLADTLKFCVKLEP